MKTKKQTELIESFLAKVGGELEPLYREIFTYLSGLDYNPYKQRSYIVFMHDAHNKFILKTGIRINKNKAPFVALRFSACKKYSKRFAEIVKDHIIANADRPFPHCENGNCVFYPAGHFLPHYTCTLPDGSVKSSCGGISIEIPNLTASDIPEIKKLIFEEHEHLMKHEANS